MDDAKRDVTVRCGLVSFGSGNSLWRTNGNLWRTNVKEEIKVRFP